MPPFTPEALIELLATFDIPYRLAEHEAVFTCEAADLIELGLPGAAAKNLLVCESKGEQPTLVLTRPEQRLDLKRLATILRCRRLRFASPEGLLDRLGVTPGSVSILSLCNDVGREVRVVIDESLWHSEYLLCHPLVNTQTLSVSIAGIRCFLQRLGYEPMILAL